MPCLKIVTNIPKSAVPKNFISNFMPVLAKCVRKPAERFIVTVSTDCLLSVSAKEEPSIVASLESIGHLGPEENKVIARDLTDYMSKQLSVDKNQIFITFYDIAPHNIAKNGVTVASLSPDA